MSPDEIIEQIKKNMPVQIQADYIRIGEMSEADWGQYFRVLDGNITSEDFISSCLSHK